MLASGRRREGATTYSLKPPEQRAGAIGDGAANIGRAMRKFREHAAEGGGGNFEQERIARRARVGGAQRLGQKRGLADQRAGAGAPLALAAAEENLALQHEIGAVRGLAGREQRLARPQRALFAGEGSNCSASRGSALKGLTPESRRTSPSRLKPRPSRALSLPGGSSWQQLVAAAVGHQ